MITLIASFAPGVEVSGDRLQNLEGISNGVGRDLFLVLFSEYNLKGVFVEKGTKKYSTKELASLTPRLHWDKQDWAHGTMTSFPCLSVHFVLYIDMKKEQKNFLNIFLYKYHFYYINHIRNGIREMFLSNYHLVFAGHIKKKTVYLGDTKMGTFFFNTLAIIQMTLLFTVLFHEGNNIANQHPLCVAYRRGKLCKWKLIQLI